MSGWRWGKAGQRLTDDEIRSRARALARERNKTRLVRERDDAAAYRMWRAGEVKPYLITWALDSKGLYGPEVDVECGATEPDVDLWEAGKLYPTWEQMLKLAALTGNTPRFFCSREVPLKASETTLRFHGYEDDPQPTVWVFDSEAVAAVVANRA